MIENIFLQKCDKTLQIESNVNIILSPEYYWVRVFDLPIDSKKEALLALPSLFEDYIDNTTYNYKYFIIKLEKHKYLGFAYDEEYIKLELKEKGINLRKIVAIYFGQIELKNINENDIFTINNTQYSYQNDILVKIPDSFKIEDANSLDIKNIELSKNYFSINNYSKYMSNKMAYYFSFLFVVLAVAIFVKSFYLQDNTTKLLSEIEEIKIEKKLPATLFQTNAIIAELQKNEKRYIFVRSVLSDLINIKSIDSATLVSFEIKQKNVSAVYKNGNITKIKKYFQGKYKNSRVKTSGENIIMEIVL